MQGPNPSLTQITFPQLRQFGAAARSGWRVAIQLQARLALDDASLDPDSRVLINASSSDKDVEAEDIGTPPLRCTLPSGWACRLKPLLGELERVVGVECECGFGFGSPIKRPAAEGGRRGGGVCVFLGGSVRSAREEVVGVYDDCPLPPLEDDDGPAEEFPSSPFLYAVPTPSNVLATCRGAGVWILAFFLPPLFARPPRGTSDCCVLSCAPEVLFVCACCAGELVPLCCRRALKLDINSRLAGDSPRKPLKSSAASAGDMDEALLRSCLRSSSGR